jgi:hypothetical protein
MTYINFVSLTYFLDQVSTSELPKIAADYPEQGSVVLIYTFNYIMIPVWTLRIYSKFKSHMGKFCSSRTLPWPPTGYTKSYRSVNHHLPLPGQSKSSSYAFPSMTTCENPKGSLTQTWVSIPGQSRSSTYAFPPMTIRENPKGSLLFFKITSL